MYTLARATRGHPFSELDRIFDGVFAAPTSVGFDPALDVTEDEEAFVVRAEIPGVAPEDVQVTFEDGVLSIRGEKKTDDAPKNGRVHRTERRWGEFVRNVRFGAGVDADSVEAVFRHGVLSVRLPKEAKSKARTIAVRTQD